MASHNSEEYIEKSIVSIINQTYKNWELLITDDNSTDNTIQILERYQKKDNRIKIFRLGISSGPAITRNKSIKHSLGRFIAFCDSDDLWMETKLEYQLKYQIENKLDLSYSHYHIIDESDNITGYIKSLSNLNYLLMTMNDFIGFLTVIYDSKTLGKVYLPEIMKRQDWAMLLAIFGKNVNTGCCPLYLAKYRVRKDSISAQKIGLVKYIYEVYYRIENHSFLISIFLVVQYPFTYIFKRLFTFKRTI